MNDFHPRVKFTWSISDEELPFLDLVLRPTSDRLTTSIHYKPTDTHSYLNYASSHLIGCKNFIPYRQFRRLRRICTDNGEFDVKSKEMANFFKNHGYPQNIVDRARTRILAIPRVAVITSEPAAEIPPAKHSTISLVSTYHPTNQLIKNIISRNFHPLRDDLDTTAVFNPCASCTLIDVIRTCVTIYSEAPSLTRLWLMRTAVRSPVAGLAAKPASTPTPSYLSILQVDVSLLH